MIFTKALHIQTDDAGHCDALIRGVHAKYPQCSYTDVLDACIEMCNRHPEPSRVTLGYIACELAGSLPAGSIPRYTQQFEEIIKERQWEGQCKLRHSWQPDLKS